MIYNKLVVGDEARGLLKEGIDMVYNPVSKTIGAAGRNSVFGSRGTIKVTNDGVSIAREIHPENQFHALGSEMIRQAAERTVSEAGDGTSATIILAKEIAEQGMFLVKNGYNTMNLKREIDKVTNIIVEKIKERTVKIIDDKMLLDVAKISVEDDKLAEIITSSIKKAGEHGAIIVEEGSSYEIETDEVKGYFWNKGYISSYMVTNEGKDAILENAAVIVTDKYLNLNKDLAPLLESLGKAGRTSILLIADKVEGELLQSINATNMRGMLKIVAVQKPGTLEELEDIATLVNGTAITKDKGINTLQVGHCGTAKKVVVKRDKTTILCDDTPALKDRVIKINEELKEDKDNDLLKERKAKLADGIVIIRVGAKTESERKYLKDKIDDSVGAVRASIQEGIVFGAGAELNDIANLLPELTNGEKILKKSLTKPYEMILTNAGIDVDGKYYNVSTGKEIKDFIKEGIIDPAKVVRCSIENAVSFAKTFLTIESAIATFDSGEKKQ